MPEGDTVFHTARLLHDALAGQVLTGSDFRVPRLATVDLTGATVLGCASRGKHLLLRMTEPGGVRRVTLHSHLRMDGVWRIHRGRTRWPVSGDGPGRPLARQPARPPDRSPGRRGDEVRVALRTATAVAVGYHVHDLAVVPSAEEDRLVGHLGPDLLGDDWDPIEAARRLAGKPDRPIAEALLDQTNLAGIGNLYKCEVLFLRGVWPGTPVRHVPDLPGLVALAQRLLAANRDRWTQSTTGSLRRGETTYVYGRRAQPCRRCAGPVSKADDGERTTYWCPRCQPSFAER